MKFVQGTVTKKKENNKKISFSMYINSNPTHLHICTPGDFSGKGFRVRPSSIISSKRTQENNMLPRI